MREIRVRIAGVFAVIILLLAACEPQPTAVMEFRLGDDGTSTLAPNPTQLFEETPEPEAIAASSIAFPADALLMPVMPASYVNPVLDLDFPDPDVIKVGDTYYAYGTNQMEQGKRVQVARSKNLIDWEYLGEALPQLPAWASQDFGYTWAPDVALIDQQYVMYYTTRFVTERGGVQCIGVAISHQPEGPFMPSLDVPGPLVCRPDESGSIDAATFRDTDGKLYLLWKSDAIASAFTAWIYIQQLSEDGLTLRGDAKPLISVTKPWEGVLVEAPTLWRRNNKYYLFYSGNEYRSPRYAVGFAIAENVLGPYQKNNEPLLRTSLAKGVIGPGGQDVVVGPDGETWMLFHSWNRDILRTLNLARVRWVDERPIVELPDRIAPSP